MKFLECVHPKAAVPVHEGCTGGPGLKYTAFPIIKTILFSPVRFFFRLMRVLPGFKFRTKVICQWRRIK